ncbi:hypothetical protein DITRI_Ditri15bG0081600 [Diplodiscus trichospermus]
MASSRKIILQGLFLVLLTMIWARARTQSDCTSVLISMASCLNYVIGSSQTPSSQCCSQLANVVQSQPRCLFRCVNKPDTCSSTSCALQCGNSTSAGGPSTAITPPGSPAGSPQGLPGNSDDTPSSSSTSGGSKTVPDISNGAIFKIPVQLIPILAANCLFLCFNLIPVISETSMGYLQASAAF